MSPLEAATTDELIDELVRRHDAIVLAASPPGELLVMRYRGVEERVIGLARTLGLYVEQKIKLNWMRDELNEGEPDGS